jgi:hypothetical protein
MPLGEVVITPSANSLYNKGACSKNPVGAAASLPMAQALGKTG